MKFLPVVKEGSMAQQQWPEVAQAFSEKRRELVLSGEEFSKRIDSDGLDQTIYRMARLNFLEICKTTLESVDEKLGDMENLTNLVLHSNHLTAVPASIGKLSHLKILDLSNNEITALPDELSQLQELHTMNISGNQLSALPGVDKLVNLHVINFSSNQFEEFPEGLCSADLKLLYTIVGSHNSIPTVPASVNNLCSLKTLDLSHNKLTEVAAELSECPKLKELNLKENCFKDRRFGKLVQQCQPKSVLDYLAKALAEQQRAAGKGGGKKGGRKKKKGVEPEAPRDVITIKHFQDDTGLVIQVMEELVNDVRPYIVCCIVRNLAFNPSSFKAFISVQTKMHDGPLCDKRQKATIATHDLKAVFNGVTAENEMPLVYTARKPREMKLTPLHRHNEISAEKLVATLRQEAEEYRKEKKRHNFSGVHKYLDLLKNKPLYPCLVLKEHNEVISFPPITNCQTSKISQETKDILIEVTSSASLDICKKVMDELLSVMLSKGNGTTEGASAEGGAEGGDQPATDGPKSLTVEQVKIVDQDGQLKVVYPSRVDLQGEAYTVDRQG